MRLKVITHLRTIYWSNIIRVVSVFHRRYDFPTFSVYRVGLRQRHILTAFPSDIYFISCITSAYLCTRCKEEFPKTPFALFVSDYIFTFYSENAFSNDDCNL